MEPEKFHPSLFLLHVPKRVHLSSYIFPLTSSFLLLNAPSYAEAEGVECGEDDEEHHIVEAEGVDQQVGGRGC